ncbi:hypothetical protein MNBD_ALPHA11-580 [hydrothermal vent metagenome]|uniref:Uncharacterized protein n=1 Tax=hydrothermal vent metagenome TaxID=652676 RepID=A0A3B0TXT9_9ZZZZ
MPVNSKTDDGASRVIEALLGPVLVHSPVLFASNGAIESEHALAVWTWLSRDIDNSLTEQALALISSDARGKPLADFAFHIAELIAQAQIASSVSQDASRRFQIQIGGEYVFQRLPIIEVAFRSFLLIDKAVAYGRAINGVVDENSLKLALQTFPMDEPVVSALMMHAALGQIANPIRLICSVTDISNGQTQKAVTQAGFGSIINALFAHAQNQMPLFAAKNTRFSDIDLICKALERFHRLIRAVSNITQNDKSCEWSKMSASIVRQMSELIEPRLLKVDSDVRQALRKPRTGPDLVDPSLQLDALNGLYLLASVREALDSLALNSLVNKLWSEVGKALEVLIERNLDAFRNSPDSEIAAKRLDTSIKMAKVRFNPEYAGIIIRARDGATRRAAG